MNGNTDSESIKWQSPNNTLTRAKTKGFNELLDDELDPDVIQFKKRMLICVDIFDL